MMSTVEGPDLDRDVKHVDDDSPHMLQHDDAVWRMDAVGASSETPTYTSVHIEERNETKPHGVAVITIEKPGRVRLKDVSDSKSSASTSSSSHDQMSDENEEHESNASTADPRGESIHIEERNDGESHDAVVITPEKRGRALLRETSHTKRSASASSSSSRQMSNESEETECNANIAVKNSSQRNLSVEPNRKRSKSTPPSPPRTKSLVKESTKPTWGNLAFPEGKRCDVHFDACSVTEKAMRLGLLIAPTEDEDETEAETRLTGILQAYKLHLEKHVQPSILADLIKITPWHSDGCRHATHQRRQEIFMLTFKATRQATFQATFHTAWYCCCESVCEGGHFYCMDSEKQLEFYQKQHNDHKPVEPNAQVCHSCYDELMVKGGEAPHLELSQANLSTGVSALAKGCDSCYADMVGGDLDSITIGSLPDDINKVDKSLPLSKGMHMVSSEQERTPASIAREIADAKAENAKLRADLENERSQKKLSANSQDDPFAPREGKTLVWTGVTMTLVRSKSLPFEFSARFDTSLIMPLILSSFID
jgi:hypothetical protein